MVKSAISPIARISFGLVGLAVSIILFSSFLGIFSDKRTEKIEVRKLICESVAISFSSMANQIDADSLQQHLRDVTSRYPDILSIGVRKSDSTKVIEVGDHFSNWSQNKTQKSNPDEIILPIHSGQDVWGYLEFRFTAIGKGGLSSLAGRSEVVLGLLFFSVGFLSFYIYLRFVLRELNPQRVIPSRVKDALDTLAEGLIVVDKKERIVLANTAFQQVTGMESEQLIGKTASSLTIRPADSNGIEAPWRTAIQHGSTLQNLLMKSTFNHQKSTFSVSCAPILDEKGRNHGAIASFENVTQLENKKNQLQQMLNELDASTDEIRRQNRELEFLATRDPLTGCMNRRSFFKRFDSYFAKSKSNNEPLSAFMVDIDHFKSINDNYGHGTGDDVLKAVANTLESNVRESDVVSRYGGEEFSVLLPATTISEAEAVAEGIRQAIEVLKPEGLNVTASLGVSAVCQGALSPPDLLEQADKCLYVAKRNGRNQVVRFDTVPKDLEVDESKISRTKENEDVDSQIPFHAVTALISALAYRDHETANHSRRVADLCVAVAEGLLPMKDCYVLEIAGLLHDIGKIGVPDSILLKPGQLSEQEWSAIKHHERIGIELINTTFSCPKLLEIVENSLLSFEQIRRDSLNVSLGARILSIADAFDSMTSDRPYRQKLSNADAFQEMKKNSGKQFDPELVEKFIQIVRIRGDELGQSKINVSKEAALSIGLQIERLSNAIDKRDMDGISAITARLEETAAVHGASLVVSKAKEINSELENEAELYEIICSTNELLDICRTAQHALLQV
ncbi:MAG: diguanylate cyclase [Planctomycetota bacterium]